MIKSSKNRSGNFETLENRLFFSSSVTPLDPVASPLASAAVSSTLPAGTGITGEYFAGGNFQTPLAITQNRQLAFNWPLGRPVRAVPAGGFTAQFTGLIAPATTDTYTFYTAADSGTRVVVNGVTIIDNFASRATATVSGSIALTGGAAVTIEVDYVSRGGLGSKLALQWSSSSFSKRLVPTSVLYPATPLFPAEPLTGYYFLGANFNHLAMTEVDQQIDFALDPSIADTLIAPYTPFSVRWVGTIQAPVTGTYLLRTISDDGVRLWLDGQELINQFHDQSLTSYYAKVALTAGQTYAIRMDYFENGVGAARARLVWALPGTNAQVDVPFVSPLPPLPTAPLNVSAAPFSSSQINLTWNDVPNETGFIVERSSDGGATYAQVGTTARGVTNFYDTGLSDGTTYKYEVIAVNAAGDSPASSAASGTTLLVAPSAVTATASINRFTDLVSWTASPSATNYRVERSPDGVTGWTTVINTPNLSTSETALPTGSTIYYRVTASNSAGSSPVSNVVHVVTPPNAPTNLAATAVSSSQIDLTWSDTAVHNASAINILQSTSPTGPFTQVGTVGPTTTAYSVGGLNASTMYYYELVSTTVGASGDAGPSNVAHATTSGANPPYASLTTLFGLTGNGKVYSIDTGTGAAAQIGTLSFGTNAAGRDPATGNFVYISTGQTSVQVAAWNPNDGSNTLLNGNVPLGNPVAQAAFRDDGTGFLTTDVGDLYTLSNTTGAATLKGRIHANGAVLATGNGDMAFAPDSTLFIETSSELYSVTNAEVNAATGSGSIITATDLGPTHTNNLQLAFGQGGVLYGTDGVGQLYTLSTTNGSATAVGASSGVSYGDLATVPLYGELTVASTGSSFVRNSFGNYTFTVHNGGPDTTVGPITLVDTLDAGLSFVSGSGTGWTFSVSGSTVTMTYTPNLAAGASAPAANFVVAVSPSTAPSVTNTVFASTTEFETSVANNTTVITNGVTG